MALRYVARSVGMPALSQASGASPSAGSRPLASCFPQAGYSNGGAARKQSSEEIMQKIARDKASFQATADAIMRARRMKIEWRIYMVSAALGVGLAVYTNRSMCLS